MDNSRERFRNELVSAAEEEAAAIVESARREITTVVRRARRDLLLIRAQLHLCGVEPSEHALIDGADTDAAHAAAVSSLDGTVPRDAVVVSRTHVLRDVVADATSQLAELSDVLPPDERTGTAVSGMSSTPAATSGVVTVPRVVGVCVLALLVVGGVTVWTYRSGQVPAAAPERETVATTTSPASGTNRPDSSAAVPQAASRSASTVTPSPVLLQTTRPVWMRVDVDGNGDIGRLYPAGTTKAINPEHEVVIRAGDAGAVLLSIGGGAPAALGSAGQVVTRRVSIGRPPAAIRSAEPGIAQPVTSAASANPSSSPTPLFTEPPPPQATAVAVPVNPPLAAPQPPPAEKGAETVRNAEILARHTQWLDAYARGDRASARNFTTDEFSLRDERTGRDGRPVATAITPAQVSDIHIDVAGVGAVLSARVRSTVDGVVNESLLSEVWIRGDQQQWSLMGVRITPVESPRRDR